MLTIVCTSKLQFHLLKKRKMAMIKELHFNRFGLGKHDIPFSTNHVKVYSLGSNSV